jgi:hypothetical protein
VAAHEFLVFGERNIALEDTGTLPTSGSETFEGVLGELKGCAAMRDDEVGGAERPFGAGLQLSLQRAIVHVVDEVVWAISNLNIELGVAMAATIFLERNCSSGSRQQRES